MLTRAALQRVAVVWVVALVIFSLQPGRPQGTRGRGVPLHQIEHVLIFGATGVLIVALGRSRNEELQAAAFVVCLAAGIEAAQLSIYRMPVGFEWWDVREDSIGAAAGFIAVKISGIRKILLSEKTSS